MKQLFFGIVFFFAINQSIIFVNAASKLIRDCEILKGIYDSYRIKNFQSSCCDMNNVKCEIIKSEPRMIYLDLSNTNIREIPSNIVNLDELKEINFNGNGIDGEIPTFFNKLTHLEEIILSNNKFYGQIPKSFLDLKNLRKLDISGNRLFGIIPSEFCDMGKLEDIQYHDNMNSIYPSSCIKRKFGYSHNKFVRYSRWIVFLGIITIIFGFGIMNLIARQNKIKDKFRKLSQNRLSKRGHLGMRKRP